MGEQSERLIPGATATSIDHGVKGFSKISVLLEATGGLSLSQVCAVTGLEASTIQNWVKRGWVLHPKGKKYLEVHIARIMIINALKECIKLEHIALLMDYVNQNVDIAPGTSTAGDVDAADARTARAAAVAASSARQEIIKESELFNYLYEALQKTGQEDDISRIGVEAVVERVIKDYKGPTPHAKSRIRKALALMIYACVCTDVKRRTEAMMEQILLDLEHPEREAAVVEPEVIPEIASVQAPATEAEVAIEIRKTVSQALREWDLGSVEKAIAEQSKEEKEAERDVEESSEPEEKPSYRPWYFKKSSK